MPVDVSINSRTTSSEKGESLFTCAERMDVRVPTSCRKAGKCRECLVEVVEGMELLSQPSAEEAHLSGKFRLSCRATVAACEGRIECHTMRRGSMRIEEGSFNLPASEGVQLTPAVTRQGNKILLDGEEIDEGAGPILGAAIDVGTTTVVVRIVDLETLKLVATSSFENPQRFGGSDIMSRIAYDTDRGQKLLQRTLIGYLSHCLEEMPIEHGRIYEMIIAANSTMRDIFFGLNVESIGQKPYRSLTEQELREGKRTTTSITSTGKRSGLPIHPKARVLGLPLIGSHVGADMAACLLAIGIHREDRMVGLMDIGTNTEIVCGNRHRIFAASCPAGPAFEGGVISCGMPGLDGAIERVQVDESGNVSCSIIGTDRAEGICGSGLVDALGEFLRGGIIDNYGRYQNGEDRFTLQDPVYLTENDISELAQAKGANIAGLKILFDRYGIQFSDLDVFYLAGGFARHLDIEAAKRIGLIPNLASEKIQKIGNAAIEGATIALCSVKHREILENLVRTITHVELETDPRFFDHFVEGCLFDYVSEDSACEMR